MQIAKVLYVRMISLLVTFLFDDGAERFFPIVGDFADSPNLVFADIVTSSAVEGGIKDIDIDSMLGYHDPVKGCHVLHAPATSSKQLYVSTASPAVSLYGWAFANNGEDTLYGYVKLDSPVPVVDVSDVIFFPEMTFAFPHEMFR